MATLTKDITDQVAAIIGDTLNGWFQPHLHFDPIVVRQRYDDWYGRITWKRGLCGKGTTLIWTIPAPSACRGLSIPI